MSGSVGAVVQRDALGVGVAPLVRRYPRPGRGVPAELGGLAAGEEAATPEQRSRTSFLVEPSMSWSGADQSNQLNALSWQ
jgi:hypothetical protein